MRLLFRVAKSNDRIPHQDWPYNSAYNPVLTLLLRGGSCLAQKAGLCCCLCTSMYVMTVYMYQRVQNYRVRCLRGLSETIDITYAGRGHENDLCVPKVTNNLCIIQQYNEYWNRWNLYFNAELIMTVRFSPESFLSYRH